MMYLEKLRETTPLVICITNNVVKNFTANGLLALGASPAMSEYSEDLEDLLQAASALLINIGTLDREKWKTYQQAIEIADANNVPIVLDPVAAGASRFRLTVSLDLLNNYPISLVRGNASEIAALIGYKQQSRGADGGVVDDVGGVALKASEVFGIPAIATGPIDAIAARGNIKLVENGTPMLQLVTGAGCLLGAEIAAFVGVADHVDDLECLTEAMVTYNIAAELAEQAMPTKAPGSFQVAFLDALYQITPDDVTEKQVVTDYER